MIASILLKYLESNPCAPVIIKSKYFEDIFFEIASIFPQIPVKFIRSFNMIALPLPRELVYRLAEDRRVEAIYLDYPVHIHYATCRCYYLNGSYFTSTYYTKRIMGCDIANRMGFDGFGIRVFVIDTGARRTHPALLGRVIDMSVLPAQHEDLNGHGTWVSSCVGGRYVVDIYLSDIVHETVPCEGMCPHCELYTVKALGYVVGEASVSDIIRGLETAYLLDADVINISAGGRETVNDPREDPCYEPISKLVEKNCIVIASAGNSGPASSTIATPAALPNVLAVGAYDPHSGNIADFSSRGPTPWGDVKPDVIAPGVNIDGPCVGLLDISDSVPNRFAILSGTCLAYDQEVDASDSTVPISKLEIGESLLYDIVVDKVFRGCRETVIVVTEDGREIECTPEHKFLTLRGWVEARDLIPQDILITV